MKCTSILITVVIVGLLTPAAHAGASFINYQSVLSDENGPLNEITLDITFRLYESESAVEPLWVEPFVGVTTSNKGKIHLKLGKAEGIPDSAFEKDELWLGVEIVGDPDGEMVPRTELGSSPFAFLAKTVPNRSIGRNKLDTLAVDSSKIADRGVRRENIKDKAIGKQQIDTLAVDSSKIADKAIRRENIKDKAIGKAQLDTLSVDSTKLADKGVRMKNLAQEEATDGDILTWSASEDSWIASSATGDNDWYLDGDILRMGDNWGLARNQCNVYGSNSSTHVNLGNSSTTGAYGTNYEYATVGGGFQNTAYSHWATISGGQFNQAGYEATVGGGAQNEAHGLRSAIAGGGENRIYEAAVYASVGGGLSNSVYDEGDYSTIGGGKGNYVLGSYSTIGGGSDNITEGSSRYSTIGGGTSNTVGMYYSTIPGGRNNRAAGLSSFAAGTLAKALHTGSIVIAANNGNNWVGMYQESDSVWTDRGEQMVLRADSGFYLTDQSEQAYNNTNRWLNTSTGAHLTKSGVWADNSDRNLKENFTELDGMEILKRLEALPITQWNYKIDDDGIIHIGPVAQDFYATFGLGYDDKTIASIDEAGIALAAIQELYRKTQKIDELEAKIAQLEKLVEQLVAQDR